jgi:hypothetical protein
MKFNKYIGAVLMTGSILLFSCTKNFTSINTDPGRPSTVTPGVILPQLEYRMVSTSINVARNFTHELMQVSAPRISSDGLGVHRYYINAGSGSGFWNSIYGYMTDIQDIYNIADKLNEPNYKAIALVYKCWGYSMLTDVFGNIPYSQAIDAMDKQFTPVFDQQKDIYTRLLKDLSTANDLFDASKALTYGGDVLYASNALSGTTNPGIQNWKKLCNSMRLRLLLRLLKKDGELDISSQIRAILADPAKYPVFTATADDAIFKFTGITPYYNPYYNARTLDWRQGDYYTHFFIDTLNKFNDPRRSVWATTVKVNGASVYQGINSGYIPTESYNVDANSSYSDGLKTLPQLGIMMTYSEVEFIKAELELKGYTTGKTARAHYENGITASMTQWGVALPAGYLTQAGVLYNEAGSADAQLQQIMLQKYYALYFVDYQSWLEKKRTGYPVLPRGAGIPATNPFPSRIPYPTYLQTLNATNLAAAVKAIGGNDNSSVKVWWEQ